MLNRKRCAREAARALLALSICHFDGEDSLDVKQQVKLPRAVLLALVGIILVSAVAWSVALWMWVRL